jgi:cell division protein FtsW (lipid II flippase)
VLGVERGIPQNPFGSRARLRERRAARRGAAFDLLAVLAVAVLAGLGVLNLYAVGGWSLASHQLGAVVAGLLLLAVLRAAGPRWLGLLGWACYGVAVLFLLAVLAVGVHAYGASRWIAVGSFTFQPSELAKLGLLLVLADVLGSAWATWRRVAAAVVLALAPIALTMVQPDLSTATLLVLLAVAMLILGRVPARFLLPLFGAAAVATPLAVQLLRPYQLSRLQAFTSGASGTGRRTWRSSAWSSSGGCSPGSLRCWRPPYWCGGSRWPPGWRAPVTPRWSPGAWRC